MLQDEQEIKAALNSLQPKQTDSIAGDRLNHSIKDQKVFFIECGFDFTQCIFVLGNHSSVSILSSYLRCRVRQVFLNRLHESRHSS